MLLEVLMGGGVLAANGKIYWGPHEASYFLQFDPSDLTLDKIPHNLGSGIHSLGAVLSSDGTMYLVPFYGNAKVVAFQTGNQKPSYEVVGGVPEAWSALLSPQFNKF